MPIQTACPSCGRELRVPDNLIGKRVKCPSCQTEFTAGGEAGFKEAPPPREEYPEETPPSRRRREDEEYSAERRPERPSSRRDDRDDYDDDYDDDRPRRRRRPSAPHRGGSILGMGIGSIVASCLCPLLGIGLGIGAINMANNDMRQIREGRMDSSGEGQTRGGQICGIIGIILGIINAIAGAVMMANQK